jgi:molybdenum cofactor synthesis domain-containing protein
MTESASPTACVLIIGNEILSGKTQDANLQYLGQELGKLGIRLGECRVVRDDEAAIVAHLNECRAKYTYVFTTGGIGPTHDDITAESIAAAFGVPLVVDAEARRRLESYGRELNEARLKMARVPAGSTLIENPVSHAPGFRMENVFVLAGIPSIARAMFAAAAAELRHGAAIRSASVDVWLREGDFAAVLERIAEARSEVEIGSYPFARDGRFGANLVVRGTDADAVEAVLAEITTEMAALGGSPERRT